MVTYPDQQGQFFNKQATLAKVLNDHGAVAYLSGHVHTSLGSELYGQHPVPKHQLWEWTLADWKNSRKFRLLAWDGHKLVFSDQVAASAGRLQHPVAVFTHPPHASPKRSASLNAALPTWAEADGGEARDLRVLLLMARVPKSVRVQP